MHYCSNDLQYHPGVRGEVCSKKKSARQEKCGEGSVREHKDGTGHEK
jgi:hypothetical protein